MTVKGMCKLVAISYATFILDRLFEIHTRRLSGCVMISESRHRCFVAKIRIGMYIQ